MTDEVDGSELGPLWEVQLIDESWGHKVHQIVIEVDLKLIKSIEGTYILRVLLQHSFRFLFIQLIRP